MGEYLASGMVGGGAIQLSSRVAITISGSIDAAETLGTPSKSIALTHHLAAVVVVGFC
jgi:hypothetical protein